MKRYIQPKYSIDKVITKDVINSSPEFISKVKATKTDLEQVTDEVTNTQVNQTTHHISFMDLLF